MSYNGCARMLFSKRADSRLFHYYRRRKKIGCYTALALFFIGFLFAERLAAQVPPPSVQDPTRLESVHGQQSRDRYRIDQQIQQTTAPLPGVHITSPQLQPTNLEGKSQQKIFKLNQVTFNTMPSSISPAELESITAPYTAMDKVSIYDLYCMIVEIDALFDRKHVLGRAGLPVQDIEEGIVRVQIIEGHEGKRILIPKAPPCLGFGESPLFPISSHRLFDKYFVQKQFHFSGQQSFNLEKLEEEILRYNRTFRSQLAAEIEPGEDLGQCTLKLTRVFSQPISGGYSVDNSGRATSGRIRSTAYLNFTDILGINDSFFVSYDKTEGTTGLYMQGEIPVSRFGTFADMSYYYGVPKTISGPFAILDINGTSEQYRPGFRQILVNGKEQRLDATLYFQNYYSQTFYGDYLNYAEKHDAIIIGGEYSCRKTKSAAFAGMSIVAGHAQTLFPSLGSSQNYAPGRFTLIKMNLMKIWYPDTKWTFILRGNGNAALSVLPQSQVFQIGGMATVRGTPEAMMYGESGYLTCAEARYLIWNGCGTKLCCLHQEDRYPPPCTSMSRKPIDDYLRGDCKKHTRGDILVFIDHGGVFYRSPGTHTADFLTTIGTGAMVQTGKHCSFSGGYGHPIFISWSHSETYRTLLRTGNAFFTARVSF